MGNAVRFPFVAREHLCVHNCQRRRLLESNLYQKQGQEPINVVLNIKKTGNCMIFLDKI